MRRFRYLATRWKAVLLPLLLLGCAPAARHGLAALPHESHAPVDPAGRLGLLAEAARWGEPGFLDRVRVLDTGRDALLERLALVEAAEHTIDAQYYIWNSDASGVYLAARLYAAAVRGVRVRILLDDINLAGRDAVLAELARHPNIAIRIYNPFSTRAGPGRVLDLLGEFARLNRRMHNKSFTVDGAFTVIGGRNIGDEYFDAAEHLNFRDRDVVVAGPVAAGAGAMFDAFWNSALSRPVDELAALAGKAPPAPAFAASAKRLARLHGPLPGSADEALARLGDSVAAMVRAEATLVHDHPADPAAPGATDAAQPSSVALGDVAAEAREEILIESAYLVMDDATMDAVSALRTRGMRVTALTNSLASNDVTANHAAYARRRARMLASGVGIHELRPDAASCRGTVMNAAACTPPHVFGLHSKTFVMDRRIVYVGSLNLNLRSRYLNAESGLVIRSAPLAASIADAIELNLQPANSWRLLREERGAVRWEGIDGQGATQHWSSDPQTPWTRRAVAALIAALPIEKYL